MEQLERWALAEKMGIIPGAREECRTLHADGSKLEKRRRGHGKATCPTNGAQIATEDVFVR